MDVQKVNPWIAPVSITYVNRIKTPWKNILIWYVYVQIKILLQHET